MSDATSTETKTPDLVDSKVPADQGLSSLGLLLQLVGTVFAAYAALALFVMMFIPAMPGQTGIILLLFGLSIARSAFHRAAGTELLYPKPVLEGTPNPLAGVRRYILVALIQTASIAVLVMTQLKMPIKSTIALSVGLLAWPAVLAVLTQLPRFKRFEKGIPVPEDKGFEAAAILMTVLGTCGALGTGAFIVLLLDAGGMLIQQGAGVLILVAVVMLFIRSIFHIQAGLAGLRETSLEKSVQLANRYSNFGVISSFCAAGGLLVASMTGMNIMMIGFVAGICWLLLAWPLIIRRYFGDRQFADLIAGDNTAGHRRAPDAGLTGLGWLLLGHALFSATMLLPQLIGGREVMQGRMMEMLTMLGPIATKSLWWNAGMLMLQAWAGWELIRMSPHRRIIATIFSVVGGGLTVWLMYPVLKELSHLGRRFAPESVTMFIPLAINLVIPVATLILVNRSVAPIARARFRAPAPTADTPAPTA